jgi:predicted nucleic acid-binding protein
MAEAGRTVHQAVFCDTNVLVRLLTNDPLEQSQAASDFLDSTGDRVVVPDLIVAELAYVLTGVVGLSKSEAADRIVSVLGLGPIVVADEPLLRDALALWVSERIDFPDAYLAAQVRRFERTAVLSFDEDFDRIEGVERIGPVLRGASAPDGPDASNDPAQY